MSSNTAATFAVSLELDRSSGLGFDPEVLWVRRLIAKTMDAELSIGIDLGNTYSCVGVWEDGVKIIGSEPSYVSFTETACLVGDEAKEEAAVNVRNTVRSVKRALGKDFDSADVQADMKHWLYKAVEGRDQKPAIQIIHAASEEHISIRDIF
eukprot:20208-Heterococcus_DN1.PRE.2